MVKLLQLKVEEHSNINTLVCDIMFCSRHFYWCRKNAAVV